MKLKATINTEPWHHFYGSLTLQILVEFLCLGHFLRNCKGYRAMKLGSYLHLEEKRSTLLSILSLDLPFYGSMTSPFLSSFAFRSFFINLMAMAMYTS